MILQDVQSRFHYLPEAALRRILTRLELSVCEKFTALPTFIKLSAWSRAASTHHSGLYGHLPCARRTAADFRGI